MMEEVALPTPDLQLPKPKSLLVLVFVFVVLIFAVTGFLLYQSFSKSKNSSIYVPLPTIAPTSTPTNQIANWLSYTDTKYNFSFQYPLIYEVAAEDKNVTDQPHVFLSLINRQNLNYPDFGIVIVKTTTTPQVWINEKNYCPSSFDSCIPIKNGPISQSLQVETINRHYGGIETLVQHNGYLYIFSLGYKEPNKRPDNVIIDQYNQILSTFKFITPTEAEPTSKTAEYQIPQDWKRTQLFGVLTLCLPPKWETDQGGNIYFNRDPQYRPNITYIKEIPYTNGSQKEAYFKFWETDYPNIRQTAKVNEVAISNSIILYFDGPEGDKIVWLAENKLWQAGISSWSYVNNSKTAFLKDFYTMISCSF